MTSHRCWRCHGRGCLGYLPEGAPLICRMCHGSGYQITLTWVTLTNKQPRWSRLKAAWHRFVKRHIVDQNPWEE